MIENGRKSNPPKGLAKVPLVFRRWAMRRLIITSITLVLAGLGLVFTNAGRLAVGGSNPRPSWNRAGGVAGSIISLEGGVLRAWAVDVRQPERELDVLLAYDGIPFATVRANATDADLSDAFGSSVGHAFRYTLPVRDNATHLLTLTPAAPDLASKQIASIRVLRGPGTAVDYSGTADDEVLFGGGSADRIFGMSGNDVIYGDAGNDVLLGNQGNDLVYGGPGDDTLYGGQGNDFVSGGDGNDYLSGDPGDDRLEGGPGNDVYEYKSGDGNDVILDLQGNNVLTCTGIRGTLSKPAPDAVITFANGSIKLEGRTLDFTNVSSCL